MAFLDVVPFYGPHHSLISVTIYVDKFVLDIRGLPFWLLVATVWLAAPLRLSMTSTSGLIDVVCPVPLQLTLGLLIR